MSEHFKLLLENFVKSKNFDVLGANIFSVWEEIVPNNLRNHCYLKDLENDRLIVIVTKPVIKQELLMIQANILNFYQKKLPDVQIKGMSLFMG